MAQLFNHKSLGDEPMQQLNFCKSEFSPNRIGEFEQNEDYMIDPFNATKEAQKSNPFDSMTSYNLWGPDKSDLLIGNYL